MTKSPPPVKRKKSKTPIPFEYFQMTPIKPDTSKFKEITSHIKTPFMEMICGTLTDEERVKSLTRAILDIDKEEYAKIIASRIVELQNKLKECEKSKKKE